MLVKDLDIVHPNVAENAGYLDDIEVLYRGGAELKRRATEFLARDPKEPLDSYAWRCEQFTAENFLLSIIGYYGSALFETSPTIAAPENSIVQDFIDNADNNGTKLVDFFRRAFVDSQECRVSGLPLFRDAWILLDRPSEVSMAVSRGDQKQYLKPYLVLYDPRQVINWSVDRFGALEWAVVYIKSEDRRVGVPVSITDTWYVFDRNNYKRYEAKRNEAGEKAKEASLVGEGAHALSTFNVVPLFRMDVGYPLWLANIVYLKLVSYLNLDNKFNTSLGLNCNPVKYTKGDINGAAVDQLSHYQLGVDGAIGFVEPSGVAYAATDAKLRTERENIYSLCHLKNMGKDSTATANAASGESKAEDYKPSQAILSRYGDVIRATMERILFYVNSGAPVTVNGFDFSNDNTASDAQEAQLLLDVLAGAAPSAAKEIKKALVRSGLPDRDESTYAVWDAEIDASATAQEQVQARADSLAAIMGGSPLNNPA